MRLTDDEREGHECCLRKSSCRADHYHSEDVEAILAARLARVEALGGHTIAAAIYSGGGAVHPDASDRVLAVVRAALAAPSPNEGDGDV